MKVGDVVLVNPAKGRPCIIVSMEAHNATGLIPDCVTLYVPQHSYKIPMNKKWIEVISAKK